MKKQKTYKYIWIYLVLAIYFIVMSLPFLPKIGGFICLAIGALFWYKYFVDRKKKKAAKAAASAPAPVAQPAPVSPVVPPAPVMVDVMLPNGQIEKRSINSEVDYPRCCLIVDGGRTYHKDVGCFRNWATEYRVGFTKWDMISLSEAKSRGLRKCRFCFDYDD